MSKRQERSTRTRATLIAAAGQRFDDAGYPSTSLAQVCETAQMSVGAITFHFANKADLADAVEDEGRARATAVLASAGTAAPLKAVVDLTVAFAELLESDVMVRAALRLAHERSGTDLLTAAWLPAVAAHVRQAYTHGLLGADVSAEDVVDLAEYLTRGAEALWRISPSGPQQSLRLGRACELALRGVQVGTRDVPGAG
ncbi:TetR family transcriptional regulator [Streptomyces sp. NBC_00859]|uniref:TetR family transcriptional regulator n=1 Tax=Streptomyces sp. NBC_00859 TaxID=2903682 RepID=UPI0038664A69|nr:TetR family transcriptional regulator [Streptomyces sp. NBC_00859]